MTARSPQGLLLSVALHAFVVVMVLLVSFVGCQQTNQRPRILELVVAGDGDNYRATEAPALGSPDSIKVTMPAALPKPERVVAPPVPEAPAVTVEKAPPEKAEPVIPNLAKNLQRQLKQAETRAKAQVAKERKEREKLEKQTKEEFDRKNQPKAVEAKAPPPKVAKIDGAGIRKGVLGGSTSNKVGGAGGKALTAAERSNVDAYGAMLTQRLQEQLEQTPGLNDGLVAEAEFHIMADGRLTRARIVKGSGDETFDLAVVRAIGAVRMPERPKGLEELQTIPFTTHAKQ